MFSQFVTLGGKYYKQLKTLRRPARDVSTVPLPVQALQYDTEWIISTMQMENIVKCDRRICTTLVSAARILLSRRILKASWEYWFLIRVLSIIIYTLTLRSYFTQTAAEQQIVLRRTMCDGQRLKVSAPGLVIDGLKLTYRQCVLCKRRVDGVKGVWKASADAWFIWAVAIVPWIWIDSVEHAQGLWLVEINIISVLVHVWL